jgi:hypothetical protein
MTDPNKPPQLKPVHIQVDPLALYFLRLYYVVDCRLNEIFSDPVELHRFVAKVEEIEFFEGLERLGKVYCRLHPYSNPLQGGAPGLRSGDARPSAV